MNPLRKQTTKSPVSVFVLRNCLSLCLACLVFALAFSTANAQLPVTQIRSIAPLGAQAGTTVEVHLANGDELADATGLLFNHAGITAQPKLQGEGAAAKPVPQRFLVNIAPDVPSGLYEVRVQGFFGVSNPRTFEVGTLTETPEAEPNNSFDKATPFKLESVVNGTIHAAGEIDTYKFEGKQGQRVLAYCRAAQLDSRLNAVVELHDNNGKRLAYARNNKQQDALVDAVLPTDGTYFLKVYDLQFLGSIDHGYRLKVSTSPFIDFAIPSSVPAGAKTEVTLYGRNLPGGTETQQTVDKKPLQALKVTIDAPAKTDALPIGELFNSSQYDINGFTYRFQNESQTSNPISLYFSDAAIGAEQEPNNSPTEAQAISIPGEYTGQFQTKGDSDYYVFEAEKNDVYYIEVFGQRNGTAADPMFILEQLSTDKEGKETTKRLTLQDDRATELLGPGFTTKSQDPVFRWAVPVTGKYRVLVRDRFFESRGNSQLVYRLAIRHDSPDFHLIALPIKNKPAGDVITETGALTLRKGENRELTILIGRKDNFNGPINIQVEGLPAGVSYQLKPIVGAASQTRLILSSTKDVAIATSRLKITGKAHIEYPHAGRVVAAAGATLKQKQDALKKLQAVQATKQTETDTANQNITKAVEASKAKPDDAALQQILIESVKAAAKTDMAVKQAAAAVKQAEAAVTAAQNSLNQATENQKKLARDVVRVARTGTIAWNTMSNVAVVPRLAQQLYVSIIDEPAPYQVTTNATEITLFQGQQFFLPVQMPIGTALSNNVELTVTGLAKVNKVTADPQTLTKAQTSGHLRLIALADAPAAEHNLYLKTKNKFSYRKHLARLTAAKSKQTQQVEAVKQSDAAVKTAVANIATATKQVATATAEMKTADQNVVVAKQKLAELQTALKQAQQLETEYVQVTKELAAVSQSAKTTLDRITELAKKSSNAEVAKSLTATTQQTELSLKQLQLAKQASQVSLKAAQVVSQTANTTVKDQTTSLKTAETNVITAQQKVEQATAASKAAAAKKVEAETNLKAAQAAKTAIDAKVKAAEAVSKAKDIEIYPPSNLFKLIVKPAPGKLTATVPNKGSVKQGGELAVKVNLVRAKNFKGPIKLSLMLPPGKTGITAEPVELLADQTETALTLKVASETPEGALANVAIRATAEMNGPAVFDAVFSLTITK